MARAEAAQTILVQSGFYLDQHTYHIKEVEEEREVLESRASHLATRIVRPLLTGICNRLHKFKIFSRIWYKHESECD